MSPEHAASFAGLVKLYHMVRNQFPFLRRKEIPKWTESNLSYSLHKSSRGAFEWNKVYAPEIECLYSRKQATLFYHRVATIHKEAQHLLKLSINFKKRLIQLIIAMTQTEASCKHKLRHKDIVLHCPCLWNLLKMFYPNKEIKSPYM